MFGLVETGGVDVAFVRERTVGFDEARDRALAADWESLERDSGATRDRLHPFARLLVDRPNGVLVWSILRSACGSFSGRLTSAPIGPGNVEVHWPEGNALLPSAAVDPDSMEPDHNATVTIIRLPAPEPAAV